MNESPETRRTGPRRAPLREVAGILAEARLPSPRRRAFWGVGAALVAWLLLGVAVESSQAIRFRLADPWPATEPALWTPEGQHVESLRIASGQLSACLYQRGLDGELLAITPDPALGPQGLYWSLWVISMLPDFDLRPVGADGSAAPARYLVAGAPRAGEGPLCAVEPLWLYDLGGAP
ncbi:MAG: hypothetical protein AAGM22_06940 [Acidobacteriota bacterium]